MGKHQFYLWCGSVLYFCLQDSLIDILRFYLFYFIPSFFFKESRVFLLYFNLSNLTAGVKEELNNLKLIIPINCNLQLKCITIDNMLATRERKS